MSRNAHPSRIVPNPISAPYGSVAEWFKALVLKTSVGGTPPWVRIPPLPPDQGTNQARSCGGWFGAFGGDPEAGGATIPAQVLKAIIAVID